MAGIGFELKKLFKKKSIFSTLRAYGYAGIVCTGPMLLGGLLLLGIFFLCQWAGVTSHDRDTLIAMITYTLLASLIISSFFSFVITRFLADMLYENRTEMVLPSFWGSSGLILAVGVSLYGIFLAFSGAPLVELILCLILFGELIVVWNAMIYLTAIKNYQAIIVAFMMAVVSTVVAGAILLLIGLPHIIALLASMCIGYGVMFIRFVILLHRYFPRSNEPAFAFLKWMDQYSRLAYIGLFLNLGLFSHLVIVWHSPIGINISGLFYSAPFYDVPALMAFLSILLSTINFVVSVEVNFYPKYKNYYSLFNDKGSIADIHQAESEMLGVLANEFKYLAWKQLFATILAISVGSFVLDYLPLGFNNLMHGYFRILCVGYGIYALANTTLLILLYYTDYKGALISSVTFALSTSFFTWLSTFFDETYYGFGFLIGSAIFYMVAVVQLNAFTKKLTYHILSTQPIVPEVKVGVFTHLEKLLQERR